MIPVLEAVPNLSEGRDPDFLDEAVRVVASCGADVLDRSMDPDHHRSVMTLVGDPPDVEEAAVRLAVLAVERIDLTKHRGVHPRIGALDVLPFVPLSGCGMEDAVATAHRAGQRLSNLGLPVYFYGEASDPPGRGLAEIRRGGFEALREGDPAERPPDLDGGRTGVHPTAGAVCVGARRLLLAWNVWIEGVPLEALRRVARDLRERAGGLPGVRALALPLPARDAVQLSMNLERVEDRDPMTVFRTVEEKVMSLGGEIRGTEVIGMIPETLVLTAARDRLRLFEPTPDRLLPVGVARHLAARTDRDLAALLSWVGTRESEMPEEIRGVVRRLAERPRHESSPSERP
ncbi:MAG: glutamate formimidoyltransferase [Gemmatimonadota bacterium]